MRALGIDLGGTKLLACLMEADGTVLGRALRSTGRAFGPADACLMIDDAARQLSSRFGRFDRAGVGFPGLVDFPRGLVRSSIMLDGWDGIPLAHRLAEVLQVPCVIDNDVNTAALAEVRARGRGVATCMLFVAVGTGIGGAIAFGERIWRGAGGVAGEIGNTTIDRNGLRCRCGRRGCLNTLASGTALGHAGGGAADATVTRAAESLGIGLANALNLLNPDLVVLGGGVAHGVPGFLDTVARVARAEAFPEAGSCRFELARAGYEAGAAGAALLALSHFPAPGHASL